MAEPVEEEEEYETGAISTLSRLAEAVRGFDLAMAFPWQSEGCDDLLYSESAMSSSIWTPMRVPLPAPTVSSERDDSTLGAVGLPPGLAAPSPSAAPHTLQSSPNSGSPVWVQFNRTGSQQVGHLQQPVQVPSRADPWINMPANARVPTWGEVQPTSPAMTAICLGRGPMLESDANRTMWQETTNRDTPVCEDAKPVMPQNRTRQFKGSWPRKSAVPQTRTKSNMNGRSGY